MSGPGSTRSAAERALLAGVAVAMLCAACTPRQNYGRDRPLVRASRQGNDASATPTPREPTPSPRTPAKGTLLVVVRDGDGDLRSDVPVRVTPRSGAPRVGTTDAGVARFRLDPGSYRIEVRAGCSDLLQITRGSGGSAAIVAGTTLRAPLTIAATRRYAAGPPPLWNHEPPWRSDETIDLRFKIYDRCTTAEAPGHSYRDLRFRSSKNITVVTDAPRRADAESYGEVRFRCTHAGDAHLWLGDPENPTDEVDLLSFRPPYDPNATWCG